MDYHYHAVLTVRGREHLARSAVEGRLSLRDFFSTLFRPAPPTLPLPPAPNHPQNSNQKPTPPSQPSNSTSISTASSTGPR